MKQKQAINFPGVSGVKDYVKGIYDVAGDQFGKDVADSFAGHMKEMGATERGRLLRSAPDHLANAGLGAGAGVLAGGKGRRETGAKRGALAGLAGGAAAGALSDSHAARLGAVLASGTAAGLTARANIGTKQDQILETNQQILKGLSRQRKRDIAKSKLSSAILDVHDDDGATLKEVFPIREAVPGIIKEASFSNNNQFALDVGGLRKYATDSAGHTAVSSIYFVKHGHQLPEDLQKIAAVNLVDACRSHGINPPEEVVKVAQLSSLGVGSQIRSAPELEKSAGEQHYAVSLPDGSQKYPIETWDQIKLAEDYFFSYQDQFDPEVRREYAVKLAARAEEVGYPSDDLIKEAGAGSYATDEHLKLALNSRKAALPPDNRDLLDTLFEKQASLHPEEYAESLRQFDIMNGLDKGWGAAFLDPWASTFGMDKTASILWEEGADSVTSDRIESLGRNHLPSVSKHFTEDFATQFSKDPVGVFKSMPAPQKVLLARLANDLVI